MNAAAGPQRPRRVTLLAWAVFLFAATQAVGAWQAWSQRALLSSLPLPVSAIVWVVRGIAWAAAGTAAAWGLWRMRRWAAFLTAAGAPLYAASWAMERWLWGRSYDGMLGLPFAAGLHAVGAILILAFVLAPGTLRRFTRS
jgi:ABC-type Mn2+/Zn2+ transport system permease subunit